MNLLHLIKLSRPRFWGYTFGPFLIGTVAYLSEIHQIQPISSNQILFAVYFLFFANVLIYGINDIHDYETDKLNPKKNSYESLLNPKHWSRIRLLCAITTLPFLIYSYVVSVTAGLLFTLFIFCAYFYSAPPLRAKARPLLDLLFSALIYILPGAFGYVISGGSALSFVLILAGLSWASAMQLFSAIPDIKPDKEAGLTTTAHLTGTRDGMIVCMILFGLSGWLSFPLIGASALLIAGFYVILMLITLTLLNKKIFFVYRTLPLINALLGLTLYFVIGMKLL